MTWGNSHEILESCCWCITDFDRPIAWFSIQQLYAFICIPLEISKGSTRSQLLPVSQSVLKPLISSKFNTLEIFVLMSLGKAFIPTYSWMQLNWGSKPTSSQLTKRTNLRLPILGSNLRIRTKVGNRKPEALTFTDAKCSLCGFLLAENVFISFKCILLHTVWVGVHIQELSDGSLILRVSSLCSFSLGFLCSFSLGGLFSPNNEEICYYIYSFGPFLWGTQVSLVPMVTFLFHLCKTPLWLGRGWAWESLLWLRSISTIYPKWLLGGMGEEDVETMLWYQ